MLDFTGLEKGSVLVRDVLEREFGFKRQEDWEQYQLRCLAMAGEIERHFESRGQTVVVKLKHGGLVVLTDEQHALDYERSQRISWKRLKRRHEKARRIDRSQLSYEVRERLENQLRINGLKIAAAEAKEREEEKLRQLGIL